MNEKDRSRARFVAGDPLRAIAAFGVLFGHTFSWSLVATGHPELVGTAVPGIEWIQHPAEGGLELIYIFFGLSGYLIARPFIRAFVEGTGFPSLGRYLKHRFLRIVPAYWVVLTICLLLLFSPSKPVGPIIEAYLFLMEWHQSPIEGILAQAWTLRIEMRFYLFVPLVAALFIFGARWAGTRIGRTARCWTVIVLAVAWAVTCVVATGAASAYDNGAGVVNTAFAFAPGVMLAGVELLPIKAGFLRRRIVAYTAAAGVLFAASLWFYPWQTTFTDTQVAWQLRESVLLTMILGGLLVWQWSGRKTWAVLDNPVMRWAGSRSYGIYLIHIFVLTKLYMELAQGDGYKRTFAVLLPATMILTGLAAELLHRLVERPALSLRNVPVRDWFKPRRGQRTR